MVTEASPVVGLPSWRHWRETDDDEFLSREMPAQREGPPSLTADPRARILANFRVLARTNVVLRAVPAGSASGG